MLSFTIDQILIQIIDILHFLTFFTENNLFEEIQQILKYLEVVFSAYQLDEWEEVVHKIRMTANRKWMSLRFFSMWKFKWRQCLLRKKIRSLKQRRSSLNNSSLNQLQTHKDLLSKAFLDLVEIRVQLANARPILFKIIINTFLTL